MNFEWQQYFNIETLEKAIRILLIITIGIALIYSLKYFIKKILPLKWSEQRKMIINRTIQYTGFTILVLIVISELKINLVPIFGAAGLIGLVVGVASQTSIGNIVSGFFLVSEKSFEIGDVIRVGDSTGTVLSIDLLSIKVRTYDNLFIRIPNQKVVGSEVTNFTRFSIRRVDTLIKIDYQENLEKVKKVLIAATKQNPYCLDEPEPIIIFQNWGENGIEITVGIWVDRTNATAGKNRMIAEIKEAFEKEKIKMAIPQLALHAEEQPVSTQTEHMENPG